MSRANRFTAVFLTIACVTGGGLAIFNYIVDPFEYYRVATLYRPVLWGGMQRYQNAGLARNFAEEAVIVGSSVTENFLPSDVFRSWRKKATKLSISGSTGHEQYLVLNLALKTGKVKHVLWGLDSGAFTVDAKAVRDDQAPFPWYMYRDAIAPNIEYLLSLGTTRLSLAALKGYGEVDFDHYHAWFNQFKYGNEAVLKNWKGTCDQFKLKFTETDINRSPNYENMMSKSINQNIIFLVKSYSNTIFHFFLPPLSTLFYIPAKTAILPLHILFREKVAAMLGQYPNVEIYDFQTIDEIVDNLDNFKDPMHFRLGISQAIIDAIRDGKHLIKPDEMAVNNQHLIEIVNRYDLCAAGIIVGQ